MKRFNFADFSMRAWLVITGIVMSVNIFFALTLMHMAPQATVLAQLMTPNVMTFGQAIEATSFDAPVGDKPLIEEMIVRFYLEQRHEFIPEAMEMSYRWGGGGPIRRLSSPRVFSDFSKQKGDFLSGIETKTNTQGIHILNIQRQGDIFTVDFDLYEKNGPQVKRPQNRRAIITIRENSAYRSFAKDFTNPFGTFVIDYKETKVTKR